MEVRINGRVWAVVNMAYGRSYWVPDLQLHGS